MPKKEDSNLALIAFILSLLFFIPFLPLLSLVLGIIALKKIKNKKEQTAKTFAILAIVLSSIFTLITILVVLFFLGFSSFYSYYLKSPVETIEANESQDLVKQLKGNLILENWTGTGKGKKWEEWGILSVSFPENKEKFITILQQFPIPPELSEYYASQDITHTLPFIYALSGPDSQGRVAFIEGYYPIPKEHSLKIVNPDGEIKEIFRRPGDPIWDEKVSRAGFALSPKGGKLAFISNFSSGLGIESQVDKYKGGTNNLGNYGTGILELWDITNNKTEEIKIIALNNGLSWTPDGKRLAYIKLVQNPEKDKPDSLDWEKIPSVCILNIETKQDDYCFDFYLIKPIVSQDGKKIIADKMIYFNDTIDNKGRRILRIATKKILIDLESKNYIIIELPGEIDTRGKEVSTVLAFTDNLVVYWSIPTKGKETGRSSSGSFQAGTPYAAIKVINISNGEFQTIYPSLDPRHSASFGFVK
ncbi:MAG: DUF4190 domain-containing protein [Candidatus Woesearchaeota archaeon]|nr:MAG: DUF4190 domain-containing protein [Candidatus Woesearchaeota archaeon]